MKASLSRATELAQFDMMVFGVPQTQQACCRLAARVDIASFGVPFDVMLPWRAEAMARGLFGPAYVERGEAQRLVWIEMCEEALREELYNRGAWAL